jgi:ankyrin repeat protein
MLPGFSISATAQESMSDSYVFLKAVKDQDYGKVKVYLQKGANINTRGYDDGETAVYVAAKLRDSILMTFLMDGKAIMDIPIKSTGETALMVAVRLKARKVIDMLITSKADVNKGDRNGETALFKAIMANDRASAKRLLAANADWSIADNTGRTPMDLTLENRRLRQLTRVLKEAGAEY